jgi:hypothetical protein
MDAASVAPSMTAGLYCRARIDRRKIRRHDADNVDTPIDWQQRLLPSKM